MLQSILIKQLLKQFKLDKFSEEIKDLKKRVKKLEEEKK